jgi:CRISPR-associated protein Cas2
MNHYVIVYDIRDDRRRYRVVKALKAYSHWVQYSVFEGLMSSEDLAAMKRRLRWVVDSKEDSLFIYKRCGSCEKDVIRIGEAPLLPDTNEFYIV